MSPAGEGPTTRGLSARALEADAARATAPAGAASGEDLSLPARVAVVGAGLVGGSIALAAVRAGVERVTVTDADPSVRRRARELGMGHAVVDDLEDAVGDADMVFIAIPSGSVPQVIEQVARAVPMQAIITDAASLKSDLVPEVESLLRGALGPEALPGAGSGPHFVGGHPMAGSERSGPDAANGTIFQGATWVLTPTAETDPQALGRLSGLLRAFGARVLALEPDEHDRLVAVVSHLPQLAASALAELADEMAGTAGEAVLAVAGGGFRDTTRIAASSPRLWRGILEGNRAAVLTALDGYQHRLQVLRDALEDGDGERLETFLARASRARGAMVDKAEPSRMRDLVVALEDRPGMLATATTVLGQAGINIEDLAMRHAAAGGRGALLLRVDEGSLERATAALTAAGLSVHVDDGDATTGPAGTGAG